MQPRSADFDAAVTGGGSVVTTIEAWRAGSKHIADVPWEKPSTVYVDSTAATWRRCEITVSDWEASLVPRTPHDALGPYGTDLFIKTGFRFADGTLEQMPMGVFRLLTARPTRQGKHRLIGYDYSRVVARARFEVPRVFANGYSRSQAIEDLIAERILLPLPAGHELLSREVISDSTLPLTVFEEGERYGDPWKACMDMADAGGHQVFFGPTGPFPTAVLRVVPDLSRANRAWTYDDLTTKIDMQPEQDTTTGYNVYVVTGESSELASTGVAPVRASAEITDTTSPIHPSLYGRVPTFFSSSFIKTTAQAQAVADANLPLKAGGTERLTIVGFPHPAHEGGDMVRAVDEYLGIDSDWIIDSFMIDLSLQSPTNYACRAKRVS